MAELRSAGDQLTTEAFAADRGDFRDRFAEPTVRDDSQPEEPERSTTPESLVQHAGNAAPLLSEFEIGDLRSRWNNIQAEFVDEPRQAVEQADQLVGTAIERLADGFAKERASLEKQWESGNDVSTEDLRLALQRYRAFFGRLLNAA